MPIVLDGTAGISGAPISGTTGTFSGAVSGTTGTFSGNLTANGLTTELRPLVRMTAQTPSGVSSVLFTDIPSWVKRITVTGNGVSTTGTDLLTVRLGAGAAPVATGYLGAASNIAAGTVGSVNSATGCNLHQSMAASSIFRWVCSIVNISGNTWVFSGTGAFSDGPTTSVFTNEITLSGTLDRLSVGPNAGSSTFDAGTINVLYE